MAHSKHSRRDAAAKTAVTDVAAAPAAQTEAVEELVTAPAEVAAAAIPMCHVLRVGPSLSIREVKEYAAEFLTLLNTGPTDIDASGLETIDTAGVQLLLAASVAAQSRGFRLKLTGAMGVKKGAACSLGLSEHLDELAEIGP